LIYEKLSVQRKKNDLPVFTFWDKKCLNYGQRWEEGFLHGISTSSVIVLLVSGEVLKMMSQNAANGRQDNVLVEYECALLLNAISNVPVFPVVLSEIKLGGMGKKEFAKFDFASVSSLPDVPHVRGSTAQKAIDELSKSLAPDRTEFLKSVSKTVAEITKLKGYQLTSRAEDAKEVDAMISVLMKYLHK